MKTDDLETETLECMLTMFQNRIMPIKLLFELCDDDKVLTDVLAKLLAIRVGIEHELNARKFIDGSLMDE